MGGSTTGKNMAIAIDNRDIPSIKMFIKLGGVNLTYMKEPVLFRVCFIEQEEMRMSIAKLLITSKADVNKTAHSGRTALHYAVWNGHPKLIEHLINSGAEWSQKDEMGETAVHHLKKFILSPGNEKHFRLIYLLSLNNILMHHGQIPRDIVQIVFEYYNPM